MIKLNGMKVHETLPARCVDLEKAVIVTLNSIIQDHKDYGIGMAEIDNISIADTTSEDIPWALSVMPDEYGRADNPLVIIVDVPEINDSVLLSLQSAGIITN